jgi:hypothetical protein
MAYCTKEKARDGGRNLRGNLRVVILLVDHVDLRPAGKLHVVVCSLKACLAVRIRTVTCGIVPVNIESSSFARANIVKAMFITVLKTQISAFKTVASIMISAWVSVHVDAHTWVRR